MVSSRTIVVLLNGFFFLLGCGNILIYKPYRRLYGIIFKNITKIKNKSGLVSGGNDGGVLEILILAVQNHQKLENNGHFHSIAFSTGDKPEFLIFLQSFLMDHFVRFYMHYMLISMVILLFIRAVGPIYFHFLNTALKFFA